MTTLLKTLTGVAAFLAVAGFGGCATEKENRPERTPKPAVVVTKPAPPTPIQKKRAELGGPTWDANWDQIVERSLSPAMLSSRVPRDVRRFCPRFYRMSNTDKRVFWAYFFQALAGAEAGLDASSNVRHTEPEVDVRDGVTGRLTHQEGLLQLAYKDKDRYGCSFDWKVDRKLSRGNPAKTILQPERNLECGVKILTAQIIEQHRPILSPESYWATLRPGTISYAHFAKQMTNPPSACGRRTARPRSHVPNREIAGVHSLKKTP